MPVDLRERMSAIFFWLYTVLDQVPSCYDAVRGSNGVCFSEAAVDSFWLPWCLVGHWMLYDS